MSAMAPSVPEINTRADDETDSGSSGLRIRCPRCGWRPGSNDRWSCTCGYVWNTFETAGGRRPDAAHADQLFAELFLVRGEKAVQPVRPRAHACGSEAALPHPAPVNV